MSDTAKPPAPLKPETLVLHAGYRSDPATNAVAVPIYQTTSYQFDHTEHASNLFALKELGNIYTRIRTPRPTCWKSGSRRWTAASPPWLSHRVRRPPPWRCRIWRRRATTSSVPPTCTAAPGTCSPIRCRQQGIEVRFVDPSDPENFRKATDERTRAYYAETLPNPKLVVFPIREVADIGRPLGIPLIIDNTAAPLLARPFDHGAAIVVYSTTKFIGGHGTSIGGMIIDSGTFDWAAHAERQPLLNQPDPSYHGAVWVEAVKPIGPIAYIIKARTTLLRDLGAALSPFNAFLIAPGVGDAAAAHPRAQPERLGRGGIPVEASRRHQGDLPRPSGRRGAPAGRYLPEGRLWRPGRVRAEGRTRCRARLHRRAEAGLPRRQYRRRAYPGDPSGVHHPFPAFGGGAVRDRRQRRAMSGCRSASSISTISSRDLEQALERAAGLRDAAE